MSTNHDPVPADRGGRQLNPCLFRRLVVEARPMAIGRVECAGGVLEIDLAGIVANWRYLARQVAPAACAAVVKADAYGLGAQAVATALAAGGCRRFFVATLDEAVTLRTSIPARLEIAVFNGPPPGSTAEFVEHALVPVLN